jgi:hypothetical protein
MTLAANAARSLGPQRQNELQRKPDTAHVRLYLGNPRVRHPEGLE